MPNKKIKILVVPGGSRLAFGIIKFLTREKNIKVVSADVNKLAAGLYLSGKGYLVNSFSNEKRFLTDLTNVVKKEKVDIIIPALDPLLLLLAKNKEFFNQENGVKVLISPAETIFLTRDKWRLYRALKDFLPLPKSFINKKEINISYPLFIKPRDGSGSVNAFKINSRKELNFYYKRIKNPIIQEYLEGIEYTVDCLTDMKGELLSCVPRIRLEAKGGISIKGKVVRSKEIEKIAKKLTQRIKFIGPFLFQVKGRSGNLKLIEINPRFGGGMPLSASAGINIYLLSVKLFLGQKVKIPKIKDNLYFTRFDEEIYLTEKQVRSIKSI